MRKQKTRETSMKEDIIFEKITLILIIAIVFWCVGIVSLGRQFYPQVGKWLIILGSIMIYSSLIILAWKI